MANTTLTPSVATAALAGGAAGNWPSSGFLYLSEFGSLFGDASSGAPFPRCPSLADQVIPFGGISAASLPFTPSTRVVRVHTDSICAVKVGGAQPVAVAKPGTARMAAGQTEYFAVTPGDKAAVITST
jgi:hypothetical protein